MSGSRPMYTFSACIAAAALIGCASTSTTLSSVDNLAKAGQSAAIQLQQNATISGDTLNQLRVAVAFDDGYNNAIGNSASKTYLDALADVQSGMQQYAKMLESLANTYAALGDLASYNASNSFNTAMGNLGKDAQTLLTTVKSDTQIPSSVTSALGTVGGAVVGAVQQRRALEASAKTEALLKEVIPVLSNPSTRAKLVPIVSNVQDHIRSAAADAYKAGVYSYAPILNEVGAPLGLTATANSDAKVQGNAALKRAVDNVEDEIVNEQYLAIGTSYDTSVKALQALIPLHEALQANAPINVQSLEALLNQLSSLATLIQPPKAAKP